MQIVDEMLENGIIWHNLSPFSSPIMLIMKGDRTWHFFLDYRQLNKITVKDKHPIPIIDKLLDELNSSIVFTKLNHWGSYHKIRVVDPNRYKTSFLTHHGYLEFLIMPLGLTNDPTPFKSLTNQVIHDYLHKLNFIFFNNNLIYNPTLNSHW